MDLQARRKEPGGWPASPASRARQTDARLAWRQPRWQIQRPAGPLERAGGPSDRAARVVSAGALGDPATQVDVLEPLAPMRRRPPVQRAIDPMPLTVDAAMHPAAMRGLEAIIAIAALLAAILIGR